MKKLFFFAAVASVMLTACTSENEEAKVLDSSPLRLSTQNITGLTRAGQSVQLAQFAANENVGIFLAEDGGSGAVTTGTNVTTYDQPLTYVTAIDGETCNLTNVQYWPTDGNGLYIYGVYPLAAATAAAAYDATSVEFTVQTDQSDDDDYKLSYLMTGVPTAGNPVARQKAAVPMTFTHLLTKIDINLSPGLDFVANDMAGATVSILNTKPTATFSVQSTSATVVSTSSTTSITAGTGAATSAIIVPQKLEHSTNFIQVTIGGGNYIYKLPETTDAEDNSTTFAAKTKYTYNLTVNKTGLVLTSSTITAWEEGGSTSGTAELQ